MIVHSAYADRPSHDVPLSTHDRCLAHLIEPGPSADVRAPIDWVALFGNDHPVELEIGSGKGLFLANAARANPGHNFLGVELSRKYARLAAERLAKHGIANAKVWAGDARDVLARRVPDRQPPRRPCLLSRPVVEEAAQEAPGLHRGCWWPRSSARFNPAASFTSPATSRSTSRDPGADRRMPRVPGTAGPRARTAPSTTSIISPTSSGSTASKGGRSTGPFYRLGAGLQRRHRNRRRIRSRLAALASS